MSTDITKNKKSRSPFALIIFMILGFAVGIVSTKIWQNYDKSQDVITKDKQTETAADDKYTKNKEDKDKLQTVLTVEPIYPKTAKVPVTIATEGTIVASSEATVSAKIAGVAIEQILVDEGDWVAKGQTLAIFDIEGLKQQAIQANANVINAQTAFEAAKADLKRVEPLLKISAISQQDYDRYASHAKQAQADLVATQAMFESQNIRLKNAKVVAPVAGVVSKKMAQVGAVPMGAMFTIIENGTLEWEAEVNSQDLSRISRGTEVVINSFDQHRLFGKVIRINPVVASNRQAKVRVAIQVPKKQMATIIQAGMLLSGEFLLDIKEQQLVPIAAVVNSDGYDYLMIIENIRAVEEDKKKITVGTIVKQKVELGEQFNDVVVVKTDLSEQQALVQQGGSFLNNGDLVRVVKKKRLLAPLSKSSTNDESNKEITVDGE